MLSKTDKDNRSVSMNPQDTEIDLTICPGGQWLGQRGDTKIDFSLGASALLILTGPCDKAVSLRVCRFGADKDVKYSNGFELELIQPGATAQ
jgi:hypothetical protein